MNEKTLKKAISGDQRAFKSIYEESFDRLWAFVYSRVREKEQASDIVADSYLSLFENISQIKHPRAVKSYLYKIAINKLNAYYRAPKSIPMPDEKLETIAARLPSKGKRDGHKVSVQVEQILRKLPKNYEQVLRLRFLAELKIKEVAEIMGKTENNIKVMQNRALNKARDLALKEYANV